MAFMKPEITGKEEWVGVETTAGFWWVPFDVLSKSEAESARRGEFAPLLKYTEGGRVIDNLSSVKKGYGVRLSAPGYMDATEWEVYGSLKEAQRRARELVEEGEGDHATKKSPAKSAAYKGALLRNVSSSHEEKYQTWDGNVTVTKFKNGLWSVLPRGHAPFMVRSKREAFDQALGIASRRWGTK